MKLRIIQQTYKFNDQTNYIQQRHKINGKR
jgi:hypothetical protein